MAIAPGVRAACSSKRLLTVPESFGTASRPRNADSVDGIAPSITLPLFALVPSRVRFPIRVPLPIAARFRWVLTGSVASARTGAQQPSRAGALLRLGGLI